MTSGSQRQADQQLGEILSRVRYIGPQPEPSEDAVMDMVVDQIRRCAPSRLRRHSEPWKP